MLRLRAVTTLVSVLFAITVSAAFAQDPSGTSTSGATITAINTMTVDSGETVSLTPALGAPATAATPTELSYETNDGLTYKIVLSVTGDGWLFSGGALDAVPNTYPILTVDSSVATDNAGAATSTATGTLISDANTSTPISVASDITNVKGTLSVTLGASVTETVVAGDYDADLTYTFTGQ